MASVSLKTFCQKVSEASTQFGQSIIPRRVSQVISVPTKPHLNNFSGEECLHSFSLSISKLFPNAETAWRLKFLDRLKKDYFLNDNHVTTSPSKESLLFYIPKSALNAHILQSIASIRLSACSDVFDDEQEKQHIAIEFSSPNIAKPFHAGHLRSTVIGNVLSNLHTSLGNSVTRLNFLGDWGTQYGLLLHAIDQWPPEGDLTIPRLAQLYVKANVEAERDEQFRSEARGTFARLEQGDAHLMRVHQQLSSISRQDLDNVYERLGVHFDEVERESDYAGGPVQEVVSMLQAYDLAHLAQSGACEVAALPEGLGRAQLLKPGGASLYLARDLAALVHRLRRLRPDRLIYVVDISQERHLRILFHLYDRLREAAGDAAAYPPLCLQHVRFGRVANMSTRKGQVVLLQDILDEAQERMKQNMAASDHTKVHGESNVEEVSAILSQSGIVVNDLKGRLTKPQTFQWSRVLSSDQDTGVFLQYTHARLQSIEKMAEAMGVEVPRQVTQVEVPPALTLHLLAYGFMLRQTASELEPCILVQYLFRLCHLVNRCYKVQSVKNAPSRSQAESNLLMYRCARLVLADGLRTLGLKPLPAM